MSLRPDDRSSRARSRSRDGRDDRDSRDRSRSNARVPKAPSPPDASKYTPSVPGAYTNGLGSATYEVRAPATTSDRPVYPSAPPVVPYPHEANDYTMAGYADHPSQERSGYAPPRARFPSIPDLDDDDLAYGLDSSSRHASYGAQYSRQKPYSSQPYPESRSTSDHRYVPQPEPPQPYNYEYAQTPDRLTYTAKSQNGSQAAHYTDRYEREPAARSYPDEYRPDGAQIVDITPNDDKRRSTTSHRLSVGAQSSALHAPKSPGLTPRADHLSVAGQRAGPQGIGGGLPPASPLLEAYRGTYQSVSPMALALRPKDDSDLSDLELDTPSSRTSLNGRNDKLAKEANKTKEKGKEKGKDKGKEKGKAKEKKRVTVYDAEEDAKSIAAALKHSKIDGDGLIDTLPGLSHDNIIDLRKEYRKQVKIQGKGINLPKHLNLKVSGNFGKAAYVTALGRWESEGYWANFWYQSHGSRRELLIESLMGRTNTEIRFIKDEFRDKRYSDSLTRCMEKELKMDKFRTAVLMVLEERRQEEQDVYPLEYKNRDVELLHQSLSARQGGESAMLEVIIRRSDAHLREVLSGYQNIYGENFARAALQKSNNLVGEVIAHILNGVINKPARDALLLNHAIRDIADKNKGDELRYELLISRLVRIHWDKMHMQRVKREYAEKFRRQLQQDIEEATKGDFREFMCELCEIKTP